MGNSLYAGLNIGFQTQNLRSTGLGLTANYTWSHALDNLRLNLRRQLAGRLGLSRLARLHRSCSPDDRLGQRRLRSPPSRLDRSHLGPALVPEGAWQPIAARGVGRLVPLGNLHSPHRSTILRIRRDHDGGRLHHPTLDSGHEAAIQGWLANGRWPEQFPCPHDTGARVRPLVEPDARYLRPGAVPIHHVAP